MTQPDPEKPHHKTDVGDTWSDNRYKAWYWVAAFIAVIVILVLLAY